MKKIYSKEQLKELKEYSIEVVNSILETIEILDCNYGANRDIDKDLGGYVLIVENRIDIEVLKQDRLKNITSEYIDLIECRGGVTYTSSLFLLSSDFSIVVVTTEELSKILLE